MIKSILTYLHIRCKARKKCALALFRAVLRIIQFPFYFCKAEKGYTRACKYSHGFSKDTLKSFKDKRRRVLTYIPLFLLLAISPIELQHISYQLATVSQNASSDLLTSNTYNDGDDELAIWGAKKIMRTDNDVKDTHLNVEGIMATWQTQTYRGWEIMQWSILHDQPEQITDNTLEDIYPSTDGRYIAWQQKYQGQWRIMFLDTRDDTAEPIQISTTGTATDPFLIDRVLVWQEWLNDNWEIMMYSTNEHTTLQLTDNTTHDISPMIANNVIYWEGIDPENGDKEIFSYNPSRHKYANVTESDIDEDSPFVQNRKAHWYVRYSETVSEESGWDPQTKGFFKKALPVIAPPCRPEDDIKIVTAPKQDEEDIVEENLDEETTETNESNNNETNESPQTDTDESNTEDTEPTETIDDSNESNTEDTTSSDAEEVNDTPATTNENEEESDDTNENANKEDADEELPMIGPPTPENLPDMADKSLEEDEPTTDNEQDATDEPTTTNEHEDNTSDTPDNTLQETQTDELENIDTSSDTNSSVDVNPSTDAISTSTEDDIMPEIEYIIDIPPI